jgi:hypothetical protein
MINLHEAWGELVQELTELSAPEGFDVAEWMTFVHQRQEILDSIAQLEAKGAIPHPSLLAEDTLGELEIQCHEVAKGIEALRVQREEVGNQIRTSNNSKIRVHRSILRETPFRGSVDVTA